MKMNGIGHFHFKLLASWAKKKQTQGEKMNVINFFVNI